MPPWRGAFALIVVAMPGRCVLRYDLKVATSFATRERTAEYALSAFIVKVVEAIPAFEADSVKLFPSQLSQRCWIYR